MAPEPIASVCISNPVAPHTLHPAVLSNSLLIVLGPSLWEEKAFGLSLLSIEGSCDEVQQRSVSIVQIVMSSNKEAVLSEKRQSAHFGQKVLVGFSELIQTKDFATFDDMLKSLQQSWDAQWLRVYSARPEGTSSNVDVLPDHGLCFT